MSDPQYIYYLAITIMAIAEGVLRAQGREAFGRMAWVLVGVFVLSYAAYTAGFDMPTAQLCIHAAGFVIGTAVSRNLPGHIAAAIFLPMATVDLVRILGLISAVSWWWAIYYLALAQFLTLAAGADFHPLGRWVRARAARIVDHLENRGFAHWRGRWM